MKLFVVVLLGLIAFVCAKPSSRVVGGHDALKHQFPYQISLRVNGRHICGGSIISVDYVLTAAHCVIGTLEQTTVVAGAHNLKLLNGEEQVRNVEKFFVHAKYAGGVGPYDIAMFKLAEPFELNEFVQPIDLPEAGSYPVGNGILSGWGSTSRGVVPSYPDILQTVIMPIHSPSKCKSLWTGGPYHESNVCAGHLFGLNSACSGDSGGPLAQREGDRMVLVGVVSWGQIPCSTPFKPGVFTGVSNYIDWIQNNMNSE